VKHKKIELYKVALTLIIKSLLRMFPMEQHQLPVVLASITKTLPALVSTISHIKAFDP